MAIYSEETIVVNLGQGLYSADLPSAIPDGYCAVAENVVATGTSIESRYGFRNTSNSLQYKYTEFEGTRTTPFMSHLGSTGNSANPSIMWGDKGASGGATNRIHLVRDGDPYSQPTGLVTGDGYSVFTFASTFISAVNYNGRIYFATDAGVYKINTLTWGNAANLPSPIVPSWTFQSVSGPVGLTSEMIHFTDRIWACKGNTIYYTDPPSSPGAFPEVWPSTNFITVVGRQGPGHVYKMVPVGTRIYLFTSVGIFVLSVLGSPNDWYLRSFDESAQFNTYECAFERQGVIYYITNTGVYLTTGTTTIKLSGMIENFFLSGNYEADNPTGLKKSNLYRIFYLDGGMLISIGTYVLNNVGGTFQAYYDTSNSKHMYSRLDNVAWSEWTLNPDPLKDDIGSFMGVIDSVQTYINKTPLSYVWMNHSRSTITAPLRGRLELFTYDGMIDRWTTDAGVDGQDFIQAHVASRFFDGGNVLEYKSIKRAYLEMFMPNKNFYANLNAANATTEYWHYQWITDQREYHPPTEVTNQVTSPDLAGNEFAVLKLWTDFVFRSAQFDMTVNTRDNCNFKLKNVYLKQFTLRDGTEFSQ